MVAKISVGNSLYGALAYNGEKINEAKGRLLTTNCIYNDGTGTMDIHRAMEDFLALMPVRSKVEKPVVHISLNPHPDDILTDTELQDIAWEYLEKMGFGNQPYLVFKHEDIDRHHLHIVTVRVDENGRGIDTRNNFYRSKQITRELERKYGLHDAERKNRRLDTPLHKVDTSAGDVKKQVGNIVILSADLAVIFFKYQTSSSSINRSSNGLLILLLKVSAMWTYLSVVLILLCPISSFTILMSVPCSSR